MAGLKLVEENMHRRCPHTLNAFQKLVMTMADVRKNSGKKTWFGQDKGQQSYANFLGALKVTIHSMVIDGLIQESTRSDAVSDKLLEELQTFALAFPNWQDAYGFASYFLVDQRHNAVATIERIRNQP